MGSDSPTNLSLKYSMYLRSYINIWLMLKCYISSQGLLITKDDSMLCMEEVGEELDYEVDESRVYISNFAVRQSMRMASSGIVVA